MKDSTRRLRRYSSRLAALEADLRADFHSSDPFAVHLADFTRQQREQIDRETAAREDRARRRCTAESLPLFGEEA